MKQIQDPTPIASNGSHRFRRLTRAINYMNGRGILTATCLLPLLVLNFMLITGDTATNSDLSEHTVAVSVASGPTEPSLRFARGSLGMGNVWQPHQSLGPRTGY